LKERLEKHVHTLADDSFKGREAGSIYGRKAAEYIVNQWESIGITPYMKDNYFQPFLNKYRNIIGIIEGNDSILKDEYIIVGAHYDHLGFKIKEDTIVYNGADDNASGVAALIELGRELRAIQSSLHRSVILIAFDAEEIGLVVSSYFVEEPFVPLEKIRLMFSVDMVGWLKAAGKVEYMGVGTIDKGDDLLLNAALIPKGLQVTMKSFENDILTATDTESFAQRGIPTLAVTTGLKSPYHKPEDDAHLIDYDGLALITEHLKNIIQTVARDPDFKASGKLAPKHQATQKQVLSGLSANIGYNYHHYTDYFTLTYLS
jgi:Zn-dependent M28 family amino/carboxypeptidase